MINRLNYHHLRYFHAVAKEGNLGRTADNLNVAQSALSIQIKQLEDSLGLALFDRVGRTLVLTEAGRIALDYAERIFNSGEELLATLQRNTSVEAPLRIGALSTLSRNFQLQFLRPFIKDGTHNFMLKSGNLRGLLKDLEALELDVVLTTQVPDIPSASELAAKRIDEQPVQVHGKPRSMSHQTLKDLLEKEPIILPSEPVIRAGFQELVARLRVEPRIAANVDDMAMVRLLAREGFGLAIAPSVVVADEIASGILVTSKFDLGISEPFFALTLPRKFPHPALDELLAN